MVHPFEYFYLFHFCHQFPKRAKKPLNQIIKAEETKFETVRTNQKNELQFRPVFASVCEIFHVGVLNLSLDGRGSIKTSTAHPGVSVR
jgi:hypothetical protein